MFNQSVNLSKEILSIEITNEDVFNAFMENGVEFTSENIDKILTKENIRIIEDECILRVQEVLQQLVNNELTE